jgi:hypothetical protein
MAFGCYRDKHTELKIGYDCSARDDPLAGAYSEYQLIDSRIPAFVLPSLLPKGVLTRELATTSAASLL